MCERGEDDGVPFQNNWVYSVRPIVPLIVSGSHVELIVITFCQ